MSDGFKRPPLYGIGEHAPAQPGAIKAAFGLKCLGAKPFDNPLQRRSAHGNDVARGDVGIGHGDAKGLEAATDFTLARGDASGQANDEGAHMRARPEPLTV